MNPTLNGDHVVQSFRQSIKRSLSGSDAFSGGVSTLNVRLIIVRTIDYLTLIIEKLTTIFRTNERKNVKGKLFLRSSSYLSFSSKKPSYVTLNIYPCYLRRRNCEKLINSRAVSWTRPVTAWRRVIELDTIYLFMVRSKLKARREGQTPCVIVTGNTRLFIITRER